MQTKPRVSTACLRNVLLNLNENEAYHTATLKTEMQWTYPIDKSGENGGSITETFPCTNGFFLLTLYNNLGRSIVYNEGSQVILSK